MTLEDLKERGKNDVRRAYDAGYTLGTSQGGGGYDQGYTAGVEAGKKSQYDEFWDAYQENGNRTVYEFAFAGKGWTDETFKPKYDINQSGAYATQMFQGSLITDLVGILEAQNIRLNTSGCRNLGQLMYNVVFPVVPPIDFSNAIGTNNYAFTSPNIVTIQKLIVSENTKWHATIFNGATALENLVIEGTIGQPGFDVKDSKKLSKASFVSIVNAFSTTVDLSATFSKQAVNTAFETSVGAGDGSTSAEWLALLDTRPNCTISLI